MNHLEFVLGLLIRGAVFNIDHQPDHSVIITSAGVTVRISQGAFQSLKDAIREQGALDRRNESYQRALGLPAEAVAA